MTRVAHALADPLAHLPALRPGSIRRTSHVDVLTTPDGGLALSGMAVQGDTAAASCLAVTGSDRRLVSLSMTPDSGSSTRGLIGRVVGRGFRAAVDEVCEHGTLPSMLLTELPVVALLSGYGLLYSGLMPAPVPERVVSGLPEDICAGWASSGTMMVHIRTEGEIPTPDGPPVPVDDEGWHDMPVLATGGLRRQRLVERSGPEVWAMFRDSYARPDGVTSVLHEYTVTATLEAGGGSGYDRFVACQATPRVLPWAECPQAAASATRLVGHTVADVRRLVRDDLTGTTTCTHLNDLLSSLSQVDELV